MSDAIYEVLSASFLKASKTDDVQTLAAERLAINLLQEGWKELKKLKSEAPREDKGSIQVGL